MKKEEIVLELFFNEPTKHWHFEELLRTAHISRPQIARWLRKFQAEGIVRRIKPKGKMPYYIANYEKPQYQAYKRIFALNLLEKQGLLTHLSNLPKAKTIIIFGSITRWDWYKDSDIDVFIYGSPEGFQREKYWAKTGREIETFICRDKNELNKFPTALMRNILEGYLVKGTLNFVQVTYA